MLEHARIGIVDMGSNAIRFLIAESSGKEHRIVEAHRLPVRLGQAVFQNGQIPESAIADHDGLRREDLRGIGGFFAPATAARPLTLGPQKSRRLRVTPTARAGAHSLL